MLSVANLFRIMPSSSHSHFFFWHFDQFIHVAQDFYRFPPICDILFNFELELFPLLLRMVSMHCLVYLVSSDSFFRPSHGISAWLAASPPPPDKGWLHISPRVLFHNYLCSCLVSIFHARETWWGQGPCLCFLILYPQCLLLFLSWYKHPIEICCMNE